MTSSSSASALSNSGEPGRLRPCREALELRLVSSYLLADAHLPGSSEPDELTHYSPVGHHQTPTIAGDVGHRKPRRQAHLTRGELLYRVACSLCFLGNRSAVVSFTAVPRRRLSSPEQLRRPFRGGAATFWLSSVPRVYPAS
ncbi:hypothetical protein QYE76_065860 [Lolium multiflorum]|uniref:Uncharacterized protein n=1 Tax=Lolium multiflorum TaxID=4521 RepID=A0AAD8SA03_LOLMU|nr:hypothetical protein QYE76_065860 [Lolium multiflorum]